MEEAEGVVLTKDMGAYLAYLNKRRGPDVVRRTCWSIAVGMTVVYVALAIGGMERMASTIITLGIVVVLSIVGSIAHRKLKALGKMEFDWHGAIFDH